MKVKDIETVLQRVQQRYENFVDAESRYNGETDEDKKADHKLEVDTLRKQLFDYVTKHQIEGSPTFIEVKQFLDWKGYVESLIDKLKRKETEKQQNLKKGERDEQRLREKRKIALRDELLTFLIQCEAHEASKQFCKKTRCDALKSCQEKIKEYFTDIVVTHNDFDTICSKLAEIIRNTINRVKIALKPENHWVNLKVFLTVDNPIIDALQEGEES